MSSSSPPMIWFFLRYCPSRGSSFALLNEQDTIPILTARWEIRHECRHAAADVRQSVMSSSSPPSFPYSFFPGIPVFVPPFSGNFRKIFPPNAYRPPDDEFRTLGISADFLESGRGFRKKSRFFRHHPRHSSRLRHLHAWYIGKKIHDPIEILEKIVTFYAADRPAPNFAHRVYLGINTKSDRDSQKKSPLFRCIRSPRPIRTFGISAKKLKSDRDSRKKSRFFLRAIREALPAADLHTWYIGARF